MLLGVPEEDIFIAEYFLLTMGIVLQYFFNSEMWVQVVWISEIELYIVAIADGWIEISPNYGLGWVLAVQQTVFPILLIINHRMRGIGGMGEG